MAFNFVNKPGYKKFMGLLYGWGASVVILGALFKILHLPGASFMLMAGMGTEAIIFFFSAFEKPHPEYDWDRVYPVLGNKPDGTPMYPDGEGAPMPFHGGNASQNILSDKLEEMLEKANVTPAVFEKLSSGIEKLTRTTESLNSMGNVAGINQNYAGSAFQICRDLVHNRFFQFNFCHECLPPYKFRIERSEISGKRKTPCPQSCRQGAYKTRCAFVLCPRQALSPYALRHLLSSAFNTCVV